LGSEIIFCIFSGKFRIYREDNSRIFLVIFRSDPLRHKKGLVAVQKEIGVQNVLQTVQMKAPVKIRKIGKNRYS
jgi:hypothetical protein